MFVTRNNHLAQVCDGQELMEYVRLGKTLAQGQAVARFYIPETACLNEAGLREAARTMKAKVECAKLYHKFEVCRNKRFGLRTSVGVFGWFGGCSSWSFC